MSLSKLTHGVCSNRDNFFIQFCIYAAFAIGICAAASIFSMKIPYPVVGSLISTCVTAPTSLPFWMTGEPDRCVVKKGQHFLTKNSQKSAESDQTVTLGGCFCGFNDRLIFNLILISFRHGCFYRFDNIPIQSA